MSSQTILQIVLLTVVTSNLVNAGFCSYFDYQREYHVQYCVGATRFVVNHIPSPLYNINLDTFFNYRYCCAIPQFSYCCSETVYNLLNPAKKPILTTSKPIAPRDTSGPNTRSADSSYSSSGSGVSVPVIIFLVAFFLIPCVCCCIKCCADENSVATAIPVNHQLSQAQINALNSNLITSNPSYNSSHMFNGVRTVVPPPMQPSAPVSQYSMPPAEYFDPPPSYNSIVHQ